MLKWCKIVDDETKQVRLGAGQNPEYYASIGMEELEVEQAYNGYWYIEGYAPEEPPTPEPTLEERVIALEKQYQMCRWQREGILAEGSFYSEYAKAKAQEIEDLAEELRRKTAGEK